MSDPDVLADELICAALRGEAPHWPGGSTGMSERLPQRALFHGVEALLLDSGVASLWPVDVVHTLRAQAVRNAMWELRHQQVLTEALQALEQCGVQPVLMKGTALAYSLYPNPALRTRGDTDLLIPEDAKDRAHEVLLEQGYRRNQSVTGDFISYQATYTQQTPDGQSHALDLHWKINNSELLSRLFSYQELWSDSQGLQALSPQATGISRVHAFLIACMHRCTHKSNPYYVNGEAHLSGDRLIWLYDIHLLSQQMTGPEWEQIGRLSERKGLRAVCQEGMEQSTRYLATAHPAAALAALTLPSRTERPAQYLDGGGLRQQWMDFQAIGSLRNQFRFAKELLFPPSEYMRTKYGGQASAALPWLYMRRAAGGIAKRLIRRKSVS